MKLIEEQTYYEILEVSPTATAKEIQMAYEHAKETFHSDSLAIYSLFSEEEIKEICPSCGSPLVVRYSKFGKFIGCSNYPKCKFTKPYLKFIPNKICPEDGGRVVLKFSKKRKRFFGCENYPKCTWSAWKLTK